MRVSNLQYLYIIVTLSLSSKTDRLLNGDSIVSFMMNKYKNTTYNKKEKKNVLTRVEACDTIFIEGRKNGSR